MKRALSAYLERYRDRVVALRYPDLPRLQPAPFASIACGALGTAYVLWRLGESRPALTWIRAGMNDRARLAFDDASYHFEPGSLLYGRSGGAWLRARVGASPRAAIDDYIRRARRGSKEVEFTSGLAGRLNGARLLLQDGEHGPLRRYADRTADAITEQLRRHTRTSWKRADTLGFAHSWVGVLYALLAWQRFIGDEPPSWLADSVRKLATSWSTRKDDRLPGSWCNGAAGTLLLWTLAFEVFEDPRYLNAARRAAEIVWQAPRTATDMCCGDTGGGYALLTLHRIDPNGGWAEKAAHLARRAIENPAMRWPSGLFRGHPGLVCLVLDLEQGVARFPMIDG